MTLLQSRMVMLLQFVQGVNAVLGLILTVLCLELTEINPQLWALGILTVRCEQNFPPSPARTS